MSRTERLTAQLSRKGMQGRNLDRAAAVVTTQKAPPAVGHPHKNLGAYLHKAKAKAQPVKRGSLASHAKRYGSAK